MTRSGAHLSAGVSVLSGRTRSTIMDIGVLGMTRSTILAIGADGMIHTIITSLTTCMEAVAGIHHAISMTGNTLPEHMPFQGSPVPVWDVSFVQGLHPPLQALLQQAVRPDGLLPLG